LIIHREEEKPELEDEERELRAHGERVLVREKRPGHLRNIQIDTLSLEEKLERRDNKNHPITGGF